MHIKTHAKSWALLVALSLPMTFAYASEAPPPAAEVVQDQLKNESVGERVMPDARDWKLDLSIFTELKPFTAPEQAIKLPEDQQE